MSGTNGAASPQATSPARRHQIKRSLSELASPGKSSRTRKERSGTGGNHDEGVGAGVPPAGGRHFRQPSMPGDSRMSLDMPRNSGFSPVMSPNQSRRGSMLIQQQQLQQQQQQQQQQPPPLPTATTAMTAATTAAMTTSTKDKDDGVRESSTESSDARLRQSQDRIAGNTETLTQSLMDLNEFSANASRQLDDAYYAVLEKMSILHSTVASLKDLAETSHGIYDKFEKDSRGLENQIATKLGSMGHFQNHQTKVTSLQKRINRGRSKVKVLSDRLDVVRERIERWERADKHWQERTRRRLKIMWSVTSVAVLLLAVLLWTVSSSADGGRRAGQQATDELGRTISVLEPFNSSDSRQPPGLDGAEEAQARRIMWKTPVRGTDRLRVFDEL